MWRPLATVEVYLHVGMLSILWLHTHSHIYMYVCICMYMYVYVCSMYVVCM